MTVRPSVSVIVPAYNAEATLHRCLTAIFESKQRPDEVILYDDGAIDATNAIARTFGVRILRNEGTPLGPAHGRNAAAAVASSDFLLFVDADVVIAADTLERLTSEIVTTGAIAAFGSYDDKPDSNRTTSRYANLRHCYFHQNGPQDATTFWSGIGMIDRRVFLQVGGYDSALFAHPSVEDIELGVRLVAAGHRIRLVRDAVGMHCKDWSLWKVWHTDVVRRAYPWAALIADGRTAGANLNVATGERIAAALAVATLPLAIASDLYHPMLIAVFAVAAAYVYRNRGFFAFLSQRLSARALTVAIFMHWCYHLYASATFAIVLLATRLGLRRQSTYLSTQSV